MRLVIARCSVDYTGRLSAHLPLATRLLVCKADGSVLVHSDAGGYKPMMWMSPPCAVREEPGRWTVTNKANEQLAITAVQVLRDAEPVGVAEYGVDRLALPGDPHPPAGQPARGRRLGRAHIVQGTVTPED